MQLLDDAVIIHHDDVAVTLDAGTFLGKIERDDLELLAADVLPDILLRPIREREYADALPLVELRVVELPHLRALVLRIPGLRCVAEREHAFLRAGFLLVAPPAAERRRETVLRQRLLERLRLHDIGVGRAVVEGVDALANALLILVLEHRETIFFRLRVAERDHLVELPRRVDVQERKRRFLRIERLEREVHHDRAVLADGIEHHRLLRLSRHLADDVDGLCLKRIEMR